MNYEWMQALGYIFSLVPILKKIYNNNKDELANALQRHMSEIGFIPFIRKITNKQYPEPPCSSVPMCSDKYQYFIRFASERDFSNAWP